MLCSCCLVVVVIVIKHKQVPEEAMESLMLMREAIKDVANMDLVNCWQDIRTAVTKAANSFEALDKTAAVEIAPVSDSTAPVMLTKAAREKALQCLPNASVDKTMEQSLQAMQEFKSTKQYQTSYEPYRSAV